MGDPLRELVITPTPEQRQILGLRQRLGKELVKRSRAAVDKQGAKRLIARRNERIAELEALLLRKRGELGGLRLATHELLTPAQVMRTNAHVQRIGEEDARYLEGLDG